MSARTVLTKPPDPKKPGALDNINDDLIVSVGDVLVSSIGIRYTARKSLGYGTFGQVFECTVEDSEERVAVKVIKNQAAYYHQARVEIGILQLLNTASDPYDTHHIVRLKDFFLYHGHLCLVFELLSLNLYELIRRNKFRGLSLSLVRLFLGHILEALAVLKESSVIHCDIKPENILLRDTTSGEVKLIDFGSACFRNRTIYTYIQSRFYRSPEVVMGFDYTEAVDMWSLGCVAAELFLGLPLFPAASEHDLLERIIQCIGPLPNEILMYARHTSKFYGYSAFERKDGPRLLSVEEFEALNGRKAPRGKKYFQQKKLGDIINAYPMKKGLSDEASLSEREDRESFTDFLLGLLELNPRLRWTPLQALQHPFITGAKFRGPFQPAIGSLPHHISANGLGHGIPVPNATQGMHIGSGDYTGLTGSAQSLHRIVNYSTSLVSGASSAGSGEYVNPGSLPIPMVTPPSRSFGPHMRAKPVATEPLPSPSTSRVVPIMEIPVAGQEPAFSSSFQPSTIRTYRSHLEQQSAEKGGTMLHSDESSDRRQSETTEHAKEVDIWNDSEDPGDWNPLWKDGIEEELDETSSSTTASRGASAITNTLNKQMKLH